MSKCGFGGCGEQLRLLPEMQSGDNEMTACVECKDIEACEECEQGLCEYCCKDLGCPRNYIYKERRS